MSVTWSLGLALVLFVFMYNVIRDRTLLKITVGANYKLRVNKIKYNICNNYGIDVAID